MRVQPSQQRSRLTVRALLRAADEEFAEYGYHGAQMTRIAGRADVSVGAMYRFFPDKDALARAIAERYGEQMVARYGELLDAFEPGGDVEELARSLVRAAADLQQVHAGYYRLTWSLPPGEDDSPGKGVRGALLDRLMVAVDDIGQQFAVERDELRLVLDFILEVSRARLATLPRTGPRRAQLVGELETMIAAYVRVRLGPTPVESPRRLQ